jgi:hypothetical protein
MTMYTGWPMIPGLSANVIEFREVLAGSAGGKEVAQEEQEGAVVDEEKGEIEE